MAKELSDFWQQVILGRKQRFENRGDDGEPPRIERDPIVLTRHRIQELESELAEQREYLHTLTGDRT